MQTIKTSELNLKSRPATQLEKLRRRLAIYLVNYSRFCPTLAEKQALRARIEFVQNQIRLAQAVEDKKRGL